MRIALSDKKIQFLCQKWKIKQLSIFGSALTERFTDSSDIDLLVLFADDATWTLFDLDDIQQDFEEIFGRRVDIVTKKGIESSRNQSRKSEILSSAKVIYDAA